MLEWSRDFCMFCGRRVCLDWFQTWYMHSWSDFTVLINYWSRPSIRDQLSALLDCIIRLVWNWGQITEMHYLCLSPIKSLTQKWWMSRWPMCLIKRGHLTCRHIHPASLVILYSGLTNVNKIFAFHFPRPNRCCLVSMRVRNKHIVKNEIRESCSFPRKMLR